MPNHWTGEVNTTHSNPQASPKDETIINYIDTPLSIYKVNMVMGEGENALMYSLNFTTQESFRNQVCKISQSYKVNHQRLWKKYCVIRTILTLPENYLLRRLQTMSRLCFLICDHLWHLFIYAKYQIQNSIINHQHIYSMRLQKDFTSEPLMTCISRGHMTMKKTYQTH